MPAGDPQMPGSAHANPTPSGSHIRVTFVPQDIQEVYRTATAATFTEMVMLLQHMWQPTDSLVELKWETADAVGHTIGVGHASDSDADTGSASVDSASGGSENAAA